MAYRSARIIRCGGTKIDGTPPTAQTPGPNTLKLFTEAPQEDTFRGIGGIFEFHPRSQDNKLFVARESRIWATTGIFEFLLIT